MKFFTTPTARFPIVCLFSVLALVTPSRHCKAGSDNAITASWYAFVDNPTALDALDYLGPTVFDGETSNGHMAVTWEDGIPQFFVDDEPVLTTSISYVDSHLEIIGIAFGQPSETFASALFLDSDGQLVVQTSDMDGNDAQRTIINPVDRLQSVVHCGCKPQGTGTTSTKPCNKDMCDESSQCSTQPGAATAYCAWLTGPAPKPAPTPTPTPPTPAPPAPIP